MGPDHAVGRRSGWQLDASVMGLAFSISPGPCGRDLGGGVTGRDTTNKAKSLPQVDEGEIP